MQACRAYYDNGRFVPLGLGKLPEGTQAIITLLEDAPRGTDQRMRDFDAIMQAIDAAKDEEMPPLEPIRFREADL
ncbi:MAG: antitoxin family protein [Oscillospiraceae bacterium]|jgi:predicted DNA-binding antitoxin AbrB/MazE fold protein|nr:antitoxin family protein [Oscillospiraceae bacterium]